jgi:hypothetical protein
MGDCLLSTDPQRRRGPVDQVVLLQANEGLIIQLREV